MKWFTLILLFNIAIKPKATQSIKLLPITLRRTKRKSMGLIWGSEHNSMLSQHIFLITSQVSRRIVVQKTLDLKAKKTSYIGRHRDVSKDAKRTSDAQKSSYSRRNSISKRRRDWTSFGCEEVHVFFVCQLNVFGASIHVSLLTNFKIPAVFLQLRSSLSRIITRYRQWGGSEGSLLINPCYFYAWLHLCMIKITCDEKHGIERVPAKKALVHANAPAEKIWYLPMLRLWYLPVQLDLLFVTLCCFGALVLLS